MAIAAQRTIVYLSTTTSLSTVKEIGPVIGWNGPSQSAGEIDITHLQSTAKEYMLGLYESGSITLDCIFDSSNVGQIAARKLLTTRQKGHFSIRLAGTAATFYEMHGKGYCKQFAVTGKTDDKVGVSIALRVSGGITAAAPST